jgi:hypothetical protein
MGKSELTAILEFSDFQLANGLRVLVGESRSLPVVSYQMLVQDFDYFSYDRAEHRLALMEKSWRRDCALVIFNELHKIKTWKASAA